MRSRHVDEFNHDDLAGGYDESVLDESDPIRSGYADVLRWTVERAEITPESVVFDLGAGTGNASALIAGARRVVCVDVSRTMLEQARPKLAHLKRVDYVCADLLEFFDVPRHCDRLISTYAVHHLTDDEKGALLQRVAAALAPCGVAVFGDLMFEDRAAAIALAEKYEARPEVMEAFAEEFFWFVDEAHALARGAGLAITGTRRFSDLSWGIRLEWPR